MDASDNNGGPPQLPPRNAMSHSELVPPPLPTRNRARSTSDVSATSRQRSSSTSNPRDDNVQGMALHYAYLERHVRGMKRTSVVGLTRPDRRQFEDRNDDGSTSVRWKEYFEAWIQYVINSFASGHVDDHLEPFSIKIVRSGVDRLYGLGLPLKEPALSARRVYRWENKWLTGALALLYLTLWHYDLLVTFFFLSCMGFIVSVRVDMFAQFGVEALATAADAETEDQPASSSSTPSSSSSSSSPEQQENGKSGKHMRQFWRRLKQDLGTTEVNYGFNVLEKKSLNDWWGDIKRKYGPTGQLFLLDLVDRLERVKNLVTWKRPEKTRILLCILSAMVIVFMFMPSRYMTKLLFLYLGVEFFVLQALRSHYPRHRRLFNVIDWLLWGVPNDAEYAMEVIRLHRFAEDAPPLPEEAEPQPDKRRSSSSAESLSESSATDEKPATSTAATLAMMVAGAAVGQVKHSIDEQLARATNDNDTLSDTGSAHSTGIRPIRNSSNLFERKTSQQSVVSDNDPEVDVLDTYGCVYRGSIPGRIILTKSGLQFRTSRVTGARVLVYYYWRDIVSVRKSKSINILVWHTNGLDITTVDGEELHFDNVIKRDDCFNKLVAAAGDRWN
ncbi:hypothetical protein O0I10_003239 [Lichtheimia ornata]|uniref:GRAM domain-containing protein n=1 Tax=Lichtheimia ornata TaxID=688661 RepID=A0AAD7V8M3_9FUNG|nr:uncharacterized protein O0I10_003239 [Lichtheimia ornata]KAJ8661017.1 hypothetical protein O0I10_003239 [Lichtheimia ornata]